MKSNSAANYSLSHGFAIDAVNPDAGHVLPGRHEIDVVNSALIGSHVDASGRAVRSNLPLPPNMKWRQRQIFPVRDEMEFPVL
jgi:hypothetical protein